MQRQSGRNASNRGWHVLRNSRSIILGKVVLIYIVQERVSESIHWRCLKNEEEIQPPTISLSRLLSCHPKNRYSYNTNGYGSQMRLIVIFTGSPCWE